MYVRQPPQSPLTNVKDTCIFPSLSKAVSWHQSDLYSNKVLDGTELNMCVEKAYSNLQNNTIARSHLGHHQMVAAIVRDNGGDLHMREKNGLHCGVRKQSIVMYDENSTTPSGIFVAEQPVGETVEEQSRGWKYIVPDVSDRSTTILNRTETNFLEHYLPRNNETWQEVAAHNLIVDGE